MIISCGTNNARGVAILFNNNFEYNIEETITDKDGNYCAIKLKMFETDISLITIYGTNTDQPSFYDDIIEILNNFQSASIIMCGDWNTVQNQNLDTKYYIRENNRRAREKVLGIKEHYELEDPWRIVYPQKRQFTWCQKNPLKMARLDYFLISLDMMALMKKTEIKPGYRSDHSITMLTIQKNNMTRGKGFWKFNTSLLQDPKYASEIKQIVIENIDRYAILGQDNTSKNVVFDISDQLFWETLKMEIRKKSIWFAGIKKREREREEKNIKSQIDNLTNKSNIQQEDIDKINELTQQLQGIRSDRIKGMLLRSKVQWIEEGEKPTKFFASIEKRNYISKLINKLNIRGDIIQNEEQILLEVEMFYQALYSSKINTVEQNKVMDTFLEDQNIKKLTNEQKQLCEGNISEIEIKEVVKKMKNDKTPGIDGLPVEVYKFFWELLGHFLVRSIQMAYNSGEISITQKRGVINCIPKGDKSREYLKNWRPISLLNTDYKIITSVMANRMKSVLNDIISPDQKGFLKDSYMEENTRYVYDLIHYCKEKKKEGLLLLIDFEKAFDSIEWSYIRKTLQKYNFGPQFIKWFNIVYNNAESCVINNGRYSKFFKLMRGCRQGDPWSPYLFILMIEPLSQCIRHNINIKGINIGNKEIKVGQYADDTFLTLDGSLRSIQEIIQLFKDFQKASGLAINVEKTQAVKLGISNSNRDEICPILEIPYIQKFKLLGIKFSTNLEEMYELNFRDKIINIKKLIQIYQGRNFSLMGRITLVKMHMLPKLVHVLTVLPTINPKYIGEISSILTKFIWNNKPSKIKLDALVQNYKDGGLKMIHVETFCKASKLVWIKRIYDAKINNSWKILAKQIFNETHIGCIFESSKQNLTDIASSMTNVFFGGRSYKHGYSIGK